jgi:hypothetical protein
VVIIDESGFRQPPHAAERAAHAIEYRAAGGRAIVRIQRQHQQAPDIVFRHAFQGGIDAGVAIAHGKFDAQVSARSAAERHGDFRGQPSRVHRQR